MHESDEKKIVNNNNTFRIRFENETLLDAGKKAQDLRQAILDTSPDVKADIVKDDPSTQDFGTTLVLILGTSSAIAIAKGIAKYLSRDRGSITIETADRRVVITGISSKDAARIMEDFFQGSR